MASSVPADEYLFSFLLLISSSVILLGSSTGADDFQIPQQRQALNVSCHLKDPTMKKLLPLYILLIWQTAKSQDIIQLWHPYTLNVLPNCGVQTFEREFPISTNSKETVKLFSFNTNSSEFSLFYEGKKINKHDSINLTASNPAVFKIKFASLPQNQDSLYISFQTSIDSMETFKKGTINLLFKEFIISRYPFNDEKNYVVELSKSCLDSIRVYFPYGGTETGISLYHSQNEKKSLRSIWYQLGDNEKNYITFYKKDIGRYFIRQASCWTADSYWLTIK